MELRQLRYFLAVAEHASFTRAAERMHISQPGISAQIRQLEKDLGATLIDRSGRGATLTAVGRAVLAHARTVVSSAEELQRTVDELNGLVRGRLVVGMVTACTVPPLFDALAGFRLAHPGVELSLLEDDSARLVEQVRDGIVDLALIGAARRAPEDLRGREIVSEPLVAAVPTAHPLAAQDEVTLAELGAHPVVCLPRGTGVRAAFDQSCAGAGLTQPVALQASAPSAVVDLARRGLGVAVLSASMTTGYAGLRTLPITDAAVRAVLALVWAPVVRSPALREMLGNCERAFGASGSGEWANSAPETAR